MIVSLNNDEFYIAYCNSLTMVDPDIKGLQSRMSAYEELFNVKFLIAPNNAVSVDFKSASAYTMFMLRWG